MKTSFRHFLTSAALLASAASAALPPSSALTAKELAQGYRDRRILVRALPGRESEARNEEIRHQARLHREFSRFGRIRVLTLERDATDLALEQLRRSGRFALVERDLLRHPLVIPNDTSFAQQWGLRNTGQSAGVAGADINATAGWDTRNDASSVIVAIIDSGIRLTHTDLAGNLWTSNGVHGVSTIGSSTSNNPDDDSGHGTHVAGIVGATANNSTGIAGIAWRTQLMALKFIPSEGSGSLSDELECIDYAIDRSAKVINASYGSSGSSEAEQAAIRAARDAGIVFVAAAGNGTDDDGRAVNNDTAPSYPANYAIDNIVSVAALTRRDALASFSNYGAGAVELAAPGEEIYSTYNASNVSYQTLSGTSMAAPHVTGVVALLRAQFPNDSYRQIINRLLRGVTKTPALEGKVQSGGRLNLAQALTTSTNRPFNDGFNERAILAGDNVRVRSNNVGATLDNGEPAHGGQTVGASLWWSWTAPASTQVGFDTSGSTTTSGAALDTVLSVYTGASVDALQSVASNDNADNGGPTSRMLVSVTAGTTYHIAVAGKSGVSGLVQLRIGAIPTNDNFANAKTVSGESFSVSATLLNASKETGEPNPNSAAGHSVWYKWTAPRSGVFQLAAFATQIDTVAAVYTGSSVGQLTTVASNRDAGNGNSDALVPFTATSGTTYFFCVDHASADGSDGGDFTVTLVPAAWEYPALDEVTASPAVGADGTVYFGAGSADKHDTKVYAITSAGAAKWTFNAGEQGVIGASPAIAADGTVYIGSTDKNLYALNGATGAKKWSFLASTSLSSTPAVAADGTIYFRDDTKLYALTSAGAQKWTFALTGSTTGTYASPAIGSDGTIYVGTNSGAFYAVKPDGTQKWKFTANENVVSEGDDDIYTSPAIAADGTVYFANLLGTVYALTDAGTSATKKWSWSTPDQTSVTSSIALGADGTLYFAGYDHKLHALSPSGAEKWSFTLGEEVRASSPAVAADGTIYVGCYDGLVYGVSATGTLVRTFATARTIRSSPALAGHRLYFGSADAKLYAIDLGQSAAGSAWPMFHHDAARTGLASGIAFTAQPSSRTVVSGGSVTFNVTASGNGALTYQWYKNGAAIPGAAAASYTIANATAADAGSYTVTVSSGGSSVTSAPATLTVVAPGGPATLLINISARAFCGTGNNVTIGGFVVGGTTLKRVLVRAVGPSLTTQGLTEPEVLADPVIELHAMANGNGVIATNDNWGDAANAQEITDVARAVGAQPLASTDSKSSAILTTLSPGAYTFVTNGKNGTSGIVLLEVYDTETANTNARFVDISARAQVGTGNNVGIGGFVISGATPKRVLLRAVGPTLATLGLSNAEVLQNPTIELHDASHGNVVIATNDDWTTNGDAADIRETARRIGATAFDGADTKSSALLITLNPGTYSFVCGGVDNATGIALVEVYDAD